jgi:acyl-CoA thioester hydrolase
MSFQHQIRVRYAECDQQGVVFNAHYMTYMDDTTEVWLRSLALNNDQQQNEWEWMLVRAVLEWQSPARNGDLLDIEVGILRFGTTSFDFGFMGTVEGRPIFRGRSVCVTIDKATLNKMPTPDHMRRLMGNLVDWDIPK